MKIEPIKIAKQESVPSSLREHLQSELRKRCKQNPQYSLRAFSKFLNVENSWLSKVLRGQKVPSNQSIEKLGLKLGLSMDQIQKLKAIPASATSAADTNYLVLSENIFEVISDWIHFAILELMKVKDFQPDEKWIAKKLGVPFIEVRNALERLQKVGLLQTAGESWKDSSGGFTTHNLGPNFTSEARRRLQESIIRKSLLALQTLAITERDHSSMMMATNKYKLEEAKFRIDTFRKELCEFLEDCSDKDAVFQLSVGLFPITKSK